MDSKLQHWWKWEQWGRSKNMKVSLEHKQIMEHGTTTLSNKETIHIVHQVIQHKPPVFLLRFNHASRLLARNTWGVAPHIHVDYRNLKWPWVAYLHSMSIYASHIHSLHTLMGCTMNEWYSDDRLGRLLINNQRYCGILHLRFSPINALQFWMWTNTWLCHNNVLMYTML